MRAPSDFQPQLVNTQTLPFASPPTWLRSQRFPNEEAFVQADRHAMEVAQIQHDSFKDLLFHLVYSERWTDIEALRVLFRWMTCKHMYSIEFAGAPKGSPEELIQGFREGKSTYCRIFELLCLYSGIPCITVVGYAKGVEFRPGMQFQQQRLNHSWNIVFVDGCWQLIDSHWATRYLQSNDSNIPENMVYEYDDFYFCPNPEAFVYSHFPDDPKWQLLKQPLSMYDFEDLPVAKSAFFKNDLKFLSHDRGVIGTQGGCLNLSLGNYHPLTFTFKLLFGEECRDELGGVKLTRYGIQETKDGQLNLYIRSPAKGFYYLTIYATPIQRGDESIYSAVCEYKVVCDTPFPNCEPYPFVSDTNWGPGAAVYLAGLIPKVRDAVIVSHDGHVELDFEKVRPLRVLAKLHNSHLTDQQCEQAVQQDDGETLTRVDIDLPVTGEYALEIYANDPARDGNTYTQVCQYLLVKPEKADNFDALFYQSPQYKQSYNVYGYQDPLQPVAFDLEQLARSLPDARLSEPQSQKMAPRPSAAKLNQKPVEQITVTKAKPTPAAKTAGPGATAGSTQVPAAKSVPVPQVVVDKPSVAAKPGKPAPKPKPKPGAAVDDYANVSSAGLQSSAYNPDGTFQSEGVDPYGRDIRSPGGPATFGQDVRLSQTPGQPGSSLEGYRSPGGYGQGKGSYASQDPSLYSNQPVQTAGQGMYGSQDGRGSEYGNQPAANQLSSSQVPSKGVYGLQDGRQPDGGQPAGANVVSSIQIPSKGKYTDLGYAARPYRGAGQDGNYSQDDFSKHARSGLEGDGFEMPGGAYSQPMHGRDYSSSSLQDQEVEEFPPPPPASDMLNFEFAPERQKSEIPVAPKNFEPMHIAEIDTQTSHLPRPAPPELQENLVFSAERAQQFKTVDTHAVQVAKTEHNSFKDLIWDLVYSKNITDELEKARVIFLWLCTKDLSKMQFRNVQSGSPEEILLSVKQGKATYAQIYETLCSYAGLYCRVIRGYAKGADYKPGMKFQGTQAFHAWNAVLIYGQWRLIDCHWASRRMFGKKGTEHIRYELDDYYFCVDPRQLIYTHYPEDSQWQLLDGIHSLADFEDLPLVKSLFFRYCLQLETHTHAVIQCSDQFALMVNYQYYRGPGLEFTFSLHTNDGEETLKGVKLSRYGVQDTTPDLKANFWLRPPAKGLYKFAVYAREVQPGETTNRMYCAVVEYMIDVESTPIQIVPFPECSGTMWGISPAGAQKHGVSTKFTSGILYTYNGQSEIRFKLARQLLFSGKLKSNDFSEADLQSCILYRTVGDTAIFSVSVPAPGEYGLEVFVNDPLKDGKMLRHMCQYLLACNEREVSGIRFPQLPAAYLGPQQAYSRLGMSTLSNKDPLIHCTSGQLEVSFSTSIPLRATSNLILTSANQDFTEYILQQFKDNSLSFLIRLPKAGIYKFQIFAQPLDDTSDSLPGVYNYLINCAVVQAPPIPYPKQFSQWKEGCYLFTPQDGDLAMAQPPQDPTPNYIFFQVAVPRASKVAVVVGGEWTHLELNNGLWEGAAYFQIGWGKESSAALTANYGSDSASYNTLLEYRM